jgi:ABC-2 type transport system ATP-binding protein
MTAVEVEDARMLEVRGLTKRFGDRSVVDHVDFVIRSSEVCGYLGPNGAGKTTTIRMLTGLTDPTDGEILFGSTDIRSLGAEYRRRLGYLPEDRSVYPYLTGWEYLQMVGRLRSIPEKRLQEKIDGFMHLFSLRRQRHMPVSTYSKGMTQKVLLAAALLHDPELLILDEPLSGLDVTTGMIFRDVIRALATEGKVILYSSHVLEVVERVCSRVLILNQGRLVADGAVSELKNLLDLPTLDDVFSKVAVQEDTEQIALGIVEVMRL